MKKNFIVFIIISLHITAACSAQSVSETENLHYVLLFKWKPEVTAVQINELNELWQGLVPKVKGLECAELIQLEPGDYDHAVMLKFSSQAAYQTYQQHHDHREITRLAPPLIDRFQEFSYRSNL